MYILNLKVDLNPMHKVSDYNKKTALISLFCAERFFEGNLIVTHSVLEGFFYA